MNFDLSWGKIYRLDAVIAFSVVSAIEGSVYRSPTCLHLTVSLVMFAWPSDKVPQVTDDKLKNCTRFWLTTMAFML